MGDGAEGLADIGGVGDVAVSGEEDGAQAGGVGGVADVGVGGGGGAGRVLEVVRGVRGGEVRERGDLERRDGSLKGRRTCPRRAIPRECPRRRRSFEARRGASRGGGGLLLLGADAGRWWSRWDGTCRWIGERDWW